MPSPRPGFLATSSLLAYVLFACQVVCAEESREGAVQQSNHWSFQPVKRVELPDVRQRDWIRTPIDILVLARLEAARVKPSPEADRSTLLRRLYLDLTGLPPSTENLNDFLADQQVGAYERLVDRLLASPHFGERWGHHWLDLARYADSDGYEMDYPRPNAWRWRDWVIDAVNNDMPFDLFTIEQIAGDLLPDATWRQQLATGFHRNTPSNTENGIDKEEFRVKAIVDRVNTTATVWLGLTIECAECHDHKYDPFQQQEYYSLFSFFNDGVDEAEIEVAPSTIDHAAHIEAQTQHREEIRRAEAELQSTAPEAREQIEERLAELKENEPQLTATAAGFRSRDNPRASHIHLHGNFLDPGPRVEPNVPAVLPALTQRAHRSLDRVDLASWLVDGRNPLTARVEVNRIWHQLFGAGLVTTPGDFGTQGEPPSHPLLLDWLASELMKCNWSRKALIRLIVTSATYRQQSALRGDDARIDPENRLLARQNRFRLDAESLRDQYLAACGLLNPQIGGPSFHPPLPAAMSQIGFKVAWESDSIGELYRRGMYIVTRRNLAVPMLTTFDRPDANVTCVQRERSSTPLQSLTQLNDPLMMDCARALATRIAEVETADSISRIERAMESCLCRRATDSEVTALASLHQQLQSIYRADPESAELIVEQSDSEIDPVELAPWIVLVRTIMNLDEFITRE